MWVAEILQKDTTVATVSKDRLMEELQNWPKKERKVIISVISNHPKVS
jgi:hypothetical protein